MMRDGLRNVSVLILLLQVFSACATYGTVSNKSVVDAKPSYRYSVHHAVRSQRSEKITLVLAFSGGGTRAAALAFGVLTALRDTAVDLDGRKRRLLDEIDAISSVSGGSFTAAYFGLYGDGVFADFERAFLRRDVSAKLIRRILSPKLWFSERGRTEIAARYFEETLFKEATFADLQHRGGPLIVINATDLGRGVRFSFLQEYFDLLCSDLSSFPVARAVTASSAIPLVFNPVVLQNHSNCHSDTHTFLEGMKSELAYSPQLSYVVDGLTSYGLKAQRKYIHLVDGGIADNLGLLAIYEMVEASGGARAFHNYLGGELASHFIVISVNASTMPQYAMDSTNRVPSLEDTINAMSDVQVHRMNVATLELLRGSIRRWVKEVGNPDATPEPYFVEIDFKNIPNAEKRFVVNQIPTDLSLDDWQVDELIAVGRELLYSNSEFQRFLHNLNGRQY